MPVGGGEAVPLHIHGGQAVESPDGKFLYYDKGGPDNYAIWRVSTSGGKETLVADSIHFTGGHVIVDQGMYFISKPDERDVSSIRFKDFASGSIRTIVPLKGGVLWGLAVSPDQQTLLYTQAGGSGDWHLMLVENFR